jgi:hypothetical protein
MCWIAGKDYLYVQKSCNSISMNSMKPHRTNSAQVSLLLPDLGTQLDPRQALYRLAKAIDWKFFEEAFGPLYSAEGTPGFADSSNGWTFYAQASAKSEG